MQDIIVSNKAMIAIILKGRLRILSNRRVIHPNIHRVNTIVEDIQAGFRAHYVLTKGLVRQVGPPSPLRLISSPL